MRLTMCTAGLILVVASGMTAAEPPASNAPATAASIPTQVTKNGVVREDALELAQLLNPPGPLIAIATRTFDQAFDKGLGSGEEIEKLEKEHPGMVAELRRVTREATLADLKADMPAIHRRYARFYASSFTPEELAELTAFYRSPTGAKIIEAKFASIDTSDMVNRLSDNPDAKMTAGDVTAINEGAATGVWKGLAADDIVKLMAFGMRPVAQKLKNVAPQIAQIEAEIANEPDPELDAAIDDAMAKVFERYGVGG